MRWEIWLSDQTGSRIRLLDETSGFACTKIRNGIGACTILLPPIYDNLFSLDNILEFWHQPTGGNLRLFNAYFVRRWKFEDKAGGSEYTKLWGQDANYLLSGRIVAYDAGSAQADMTDEYDDMMKAIVTDALGADAGTGRILTSVGGGVTVAGDLSAAPSATKAFAWDNVLEALNDIAQASRQAGTPLFFDMVPVYTSAGILSWQFQTFVNQRGADRGTTSDNPAYFGRAWGNLNSCYYEIDRTDELNYVYGRGQGEGGARLVGDASDSTRYGASIWNRREGYCNAAAGGGGDSADTTSSAAEARLERYRPVLSAGGELLDTPQSRYGVDWDFGDTVVMDIRGKQFDADVIAVGFSMDENGYQTTDFRAEVEE